MNPPFLTRTLFSKTLFVAGTYSSRMAGTYLSRMAEAYSSRVGAYFLKMAGAYSVQMVEAYSLKMAGAYSLQMVGAYYVQMAGAYSVQVVEAYFLVVPPAHSLEAAWNEVSLCSVLLIHQTSKILFPAVSSDCLLIVPLPQPVTPEICDAVQAASHFLHCCNWTEPWLVEHSLNV